MGVKLGGALVTKRTRSQATMKESTPIAPKLASLWWKFGCLVNWGHRLCTTRGRIRSTPAICFVFPLWPWLREIPNEFPSRPWRLAREGRTHCQPVWENFPDIQASYNRREACLSSALLLGAWINSESCKAPVLKPMS